MACECASTCKADLALKKTACLTLINSLNTSGCTNAKLSDIHGLLLDDVNRLQVISRRVDEMQSIMTNEQTMSSTNYMHPSVTCGITEILTALKNSEIAQDNTDYTTLSAITGIVIPDEVENGLPE